MRLLCFLLSYQCKHKAHFKETRSLHKLSIVHINSKSKREQIHTTVYSIQYVCTYAYYHTVCMYVQLYSLLELEKLKMFNINKWICSWKLQESMFGITLYHINILILRLRYIKCISTIKIVYIHKIHIMPTVTSCQVKQFSIYATCSIATKDPIFVHIYYI